MRSTVLLGAALLAVAVAFTLPFRPTDAGDYANPACAAHRCDDAAPAIGALQRAEVAKFFQEQPAMGSFSLVVRAPFAGAVRAAGGGEDAQYKAGSLVCVLAAVALAVAVFIRMRARGVPWSAGLLLAALVVINPANGDALQRGHPEEILAAALLAGAAFAAPQSSLPAGIAVGLAIATKQWALLGLAPVAFLAPAGERVRLVASSLVVVAVLMLPMAIGNPTAFRHAASAAANPPGSVKALDVWFPFAHSDVSSVALPDGSVSVETVWRIPHRLDRATHWLIIGICTALIAAWWIRREQAMDAMWLLVLVLLLRALLDPRAHPYHYAPFVIALAVAEAGVAMRFPWRTTAAAAVLAVALRLFDSGQWDLASAVWLAAALPAALVLTAAVLGGRPALASPRPRSRAS